MWYSAMSQVNMTMSLLRFSPSAANTALQSYFGRRYEAISSCASCSAFVRFSVLVREMTFSAFSPTTTR